MTSTAKQDVAKPSFNLTVISNNKERITSLVGSLMDAPLPEGAHFMASFGTCRDGCYRFNVDLAPPG